MTRTTKARLVKKSVEKPRKKRPTPGWLKWVMRKMNWMGLVLVNMGRAVVEVEWKRIFKQVMGGFFGWLISLPGIVWATMTSAPYRRHLRSYYRKKYVAVRQGVRDYFTEASEGELAWSTLVLMGVRRLGYARSRTAITAGAIAIGAGAIVFLVSFGFGLEAVVTDRLVKPNSMKLADVQSGSTALKLDTEALKMMSKMAGVEKIAASVSLAGMLTYDQSKTDVVVVGARSDFLEYVYTHPSEGNFFTEAADAAYKGEVNDMDDLVRWMEESGEVAGAMDEVEAVFGGEVDEGEVYFRLADDVYMPLRLEPKMNSEVIGYVRGSVLERWLGERVWGSEYSSAGVEGRALKDDVGSWWGQWVKTKVPIHYKASPQVYLPKNNGEKGQLELEGYLTFERMHVLTEKELKREKIVEKVLGLADEASSSGTATGSAVADISVNNKQVVADEEAVDETSALAALLQGDREVQEASQAAVYARVEVMKEGGKEIVVSTGLLKAWDLAKDEVLGKSVDMEYILSGNLIPGLTGRVISSAYAYEVVGVVDDNRSMVYTPLSDLESMGVKRYSLVKVLAESTEALNGVREKIESLGFTTQSLVDTLLQVDKLFTIMRFLLAMVGMIALVVALFGMFNTLTVSLMERTREVGVMKTMGTTDKDVTRMFLVESVMIGLLGGVAGVMLGLMAGWIIDGGLWIAKGDQAVELFKSPISFLVGVMVMSLVVGLVTGIYPALRARNISALNALRYE